VISRTSVMQYRNTAKTIPQIAEELGVEYVLEGSVQRHGDRVRITAQLIDARKDGHVWADSYDREVRDILAVQSEVAEVIAGRLSAELTPLTLAELRDTAQVDPEAYNLYLRGRQIARSEEPGEVAKGVELLGSAIAKDSSMVGAYTALAEALVPASIGLGEAPLPPEPPAIEGALNRALAAHPRAEIHTFVARRAIEDWDFAKAEAAARRAVEANPNYARGQHWYGLLLARTGRQSEGLERLRAALSIDPRSPQINADLGELLYAMGRFDEAIAQLQKTLALDSTSASAYLNLGLAYSAKGLHDQAVAALRRAARLERGNPVVQGYLGYVLADAGQTDEANRILNDMETRRRPPASAIAQILAGLGRSEQALQWLEKAASERSSILLSPRVVRSFDALRDDPRFERIMKIAATGSAVPSPPARGGLPDSTVGRRRGDGG
jgi:tetratricopeptide (TPR) repeat protein